MLKFLPILGLALTLAGCADDGSCRIATLGDMTVLNDTSTPIISATVNGHPVAFLVDTGAQLSLIWKSQITPLGLTVLPHSITLNGVGGVTFASIISIDSLGIGSGTAHDVAFVSTDERSSQTTANGLPIVGLFGADFLRNYDIAMDLPQHHISLFDVHGCTDQIPPWTGKYTTIPFTIPHNDPTKMVVKATLNNTPIDMVLDSGSNATLITQSDALDAHVKRDDLNKDRTYAGYGVSEDKFTVYKHIFNTFNVGPFKFKNIPLSVSDTDDNLLGADFLRHYRIWIPKYADKFYIQPEGINGYTTITVHGPTH